MLNMKGVVCQKAAADLQQESKLGVPIGNVALSSRPLSLHQLHDDPAKGCQGAVDGAGLLEVLPSRPGGLVPL